MNISQAWVEGYAASSSKGTCGMHENIGGTRWCFSWWSYKGRNITEKKHI